MGDFYRFGYDLDDEFDGDNLDDLDAVRSASKWSSAPKRNATVFAIDVSDLTVFDKYVDIRERDDDNDEEDEVYDHKSDAEQTETSLFELALTCVINFIKNKIICADKDLVGCLLIGSSEKDMNLTNVATQVGTQAPNPDSTVSAGSDFNFINTLVPLEMPGAKSVLALEHVRNHSADYKSSSGRDVSFADAFWVTQNMFSKVTCGLAVKQLFLFTTKQDPHGHNSFLRKATQQKILDLANNAIEVEVLGLTQPGGFFDLTLFWQSSLPQLKDATVLPDPTSRIEELMCRVATKEYTCRALSSIKLNLFGKESAVKVYSFVNVARKPNGVKLDKDTNKQVVVRNEAISTNTGEVLMPDEISFSQTYADATICLTKAERDSLKYISDAAINVLAFKPIDSLKFENYLRPSHFLYPDESAVAGSTVLFQSLLQSCLKQKVFAVSTVVTKSGAYPRLAALYPQQEQLQESTSVQIKPPGFHVIYLPFAEDVRDLSNKVAQSRPKADSNQVKCAMAIVNKLKINFDPENFANPYLSRFYSYVEALALEKDSVEEPEDTIDPSIELLDKRLGTGTISNFTSAMPSFTQSTAATNKTSATSGVKRKATDNEGAGPGSKTTPQFNEAELSEAAKSNKLGKFTVPVLKLACEHYQINTVGKKQDLIDRLQKHYSSLR